MKKCFLIAISALILLAGITAGCGAPLRRFEGTTSMMDTFVTVIVYTESVEKSEEAIGAAFDRMEEIEQVATIFDEASQASQLNREGYLAEPSEDLLELITKSLEYSEITEGTFDITIQPLLELWSAGLWKEAPEVQQSRINETFQRIGWEKISIENEEIMFTVDGMAITLGGIAKGYAIDEALEVLQGMGIKHALVDAGGDTATLGSKPGGEPWIVALRNPDDDTQSLVNFAVKNKAVTTSGNYERFFDPDRDVHHIIDPRVGYSAQGVISATVIADTATQADALATSIFVLGPDDGVALTESLSNVECFIVTEDRQLFGSSGLPSYATE